MSFYTTKSNNVERDYVVIRHGIPNVNSMVMGVRFRNSWAVVEKGSKTYHRLRKLPMLKNPQEQPLSFLKQLPFITRSMDVKLIYGADVYSKYVNLEKTNKDKEVKETAELEEKLHLENETKCKYRLDSGSLCKHDVQDSKISSYCPLHILKDPKLEEADFKIPVAMDKNHRRKLRKSAFNKLRELLKQGKVDVSVVEEETISSEEQVREEA